MRDIEKIKGILAEHKRELGRRFKVKDIGVFGSYVTGIEKKRSDVDILVEFEEPVGMFEFLALEDYLSVLLGIRVDLVSRKALKPRIGKRIMTEVIYV
jgi:hypothetical protein